jgi:hypothetical protein
MFWIALLACAEPITEVQLTGQVLTGLDSTIGAPGVTVIIRDSETLDFSEATTDEDGVFTVPVPISSGIHMELDGAGFVPTAFSAITAAEDFIVPVGGLWMRTAAELEELQRTFESCETADVEGGIIEGQVLYTAVSQSSGSNLVAEEASVTVYEADGSAHTVCYLDDEGVSDVNAVEVGATGRFAAFGIPAGPITVGFSTEIDGMRRELFGFVFLPEDGVGPFYPALIEFQ